MPRDHDDDLGSIHRHLNQIEGRLSERLNALIRMVLIIGRHQKIMEIEEMASRETLERMNADITANTNAVSAATAALTGFVQTVTDLTAQLQAAIESGDETAIASAADAIEANNAALTAAIPTTAQAVVAGTPAA